MIAGVHACARFSLQAANELERSLVESLASGGPAFENEIENLLNKLPPVARLEGPSTIPKNSAGMGRASQAVMFPPTFPPHVNCNC